MSEMFTMLLQISNLLFERFRYSISQNIGNLLNQAREINRFGNIVRILGLILITSKKAAVRNN